MAYVNQPEPLFSLLKIIITYIPANRMIRLKGRRGRQAGEESKS
jgi:hypothetical protein